MAGATLHFAPLCIPAAADEVVEGGETATTDAPERGMPASNVRVKSILAAHPNSLVTICVAGCDGKPTPVQLLPKPLTKRVTSMRTTAGTIEQAPPRPEYDSLDRDSVLCIAGCDGRAGQVVQRLPGLPPPKPAAEPRADIMPSEPLDVR